MILVDAKVFQFSTQKARIMKLDLMWYVFQFLKPILLHTMRQLIFHDKYFEIDSKHPFTIYVFETIHKRYLTL